MTEAPEHGPRTFNFADLWEGVAQAVPDRSAVIGPDASRTYRELDRRASALAEWFVGAGVRPGDRIGVMLRNVPEHLEAYLAAYKIRAVPVNINFRATRAEFGYLADDADLRGVVHDHDFADTVEHVVRVGTGSRWRLATGADYERIASRPPSSTEQLARSSDDEYMIYSGGTTGKPKGVVWRMEDAFYACLGGGDPRGTSVPIAEPVELVQRISSPPVVFLPAAPLMHAAGFWPAMRWLLAGGTVVLLGSFDPDHVWRAVAQHQVNVVNIVADAMAGPLLDALDGRRTSELHSLQMIASGGAPLSAVARRRLAEAIPGVTIRDIYGSSETGVQGWADWTAASSGPSRFTTFDTVLVEPDTRTLPAAPGLREGLVARTGHVPLRYHGDPAASAAVFAQRDGVRIAVTGDIGRLDDELRLTVIGRGAECINTGGEKVYPREVEGVLREHPQVRDCLVLGEAHPRWGQQVSALVVLAGGADVPDAQLSELCRGQLAGYKVPRRYVRVPAIARRANGKLDLDWAASALARDVDAPVEAP